MEEQNSILPITVVAAIALFVIREVVESLRRRGANRRRISAIKKMLARECEQNNWFLRRLGDAFRGGAVGLLQEPQIKLRIVTNSINEPQLLSQFADGDMFSQMPVPKCHRKALESHLLDVAIVDKTLFALMEEAYSSVLEMEHVRSSLLENLSGERKDDDDFIISFLEYGLREFDDAKASIEALYRGCTGKVLTEFRLR